VNFANTLNREQRAKSKEQRKSRLPGNIILVCIGNDRSVLCVLVMMEFKFLINLVDAVGKVDTPRESMVYFPHYATIQIF
jgi:hypothetical protein